MVLGRSIPRRIEVGMQLKAARATHKTATGTAVGAGRMPTAATHLRGMSRVDRNHRTTPFLGFVPDKALQLRKRPAMHTPAGVRFAPDLRALAYVGQVFQHDRRTRLDRRHDLLTQHMIAITTKTGLFPAQPAQVPLRAAGALLLQLPFQMKQPSLDRLPGAFAQKVVGAGDGGRTMPRSTPMTIVLKFFCKIAVSDRF
jgi:hypothetical protein